MDTKFAMTTRLLSNADSDQFRASREFRAVMIADAVKTAADMICTERLSVVWSIRGQGQTLASGRVGWREAAE